MTELYDSNNNNTNNILGELNIANLNNDVKKEEQTNIHSFLNFFIDNQTIKIKRGSSSTI